MANGGIIGPVQTISTCTQAEVITTVTSSTPSAVTLAPLTQKINRITCANVDGTNAADLSLSIVKANFTSAGVTNFDTSGTFFIAKTISVPADATLVLLDTPIYLMEDDILKGGASVASDLDLVISYDVIAV